MNEAEKPDLPGQLCNQLREFMQCYVLVGFTMEGERVRLSHGPESLHQDALQQLMEDTIVRDFKLWPTVKTLPVEEE